MGWQIELAKVVVPAVLGFLFGRLQAGYTDKVARTKDLQNELLKAIRLCTTSAIDYHSKTLPQDQWPTRAIHLKNQLWRIRTDVCSIADICKRKDNVLQTHLLDFFDAVTQYPFEANELPPALDTNRCAQITISSESLVKMLIDCRPKIF